MKFGSTVTLLLILHCLQARYLPSSKVDWEIKTEANFEIYFTRRSFTHFFTESLLYNVVLGNEKQV